MRTEPGRVARSKGLSMPAEHWPLITVRLPLLLSLSLMLFGTSCRLVRSTTDASGQAVRTVIPGQKKDKEVVDPLEVQQKLLRFANTFSAQMVAGIDQLRHGTNMIDPEQALKWKIVVVTETCSIASGPNPLANLLDMTILVTGVRIALEEHWQPRFFGASAQPMVEMCRRHETNIWGLAGTLLSLEQQEELRQSIAAWHQKHPIPETVISTRAQGFVTEVAAAKQTDKVAAGGAFGLLRIDPFAGLDPATREIALARTLAERALFVTQWMPTLLRWQVELMSLNAVATPEVQQLVTNSAQLSASVERFAGAAERLPKQMSTEREEIIKALDSQEKQLTPLVNEVRQALLAGSQMSTSLNTTVTTFDGLMKRFGVGETNRAGPDTNAQPFRIQDYGETAVQLEMAAKQLTELLHTFDRTLSSTNLLQLSAQVGPVVQQAQTSGKEIVDYAFWKGVFLVVIVLVAALIYRFLTRIRER